MITDMEVFYPDLQEQVKIGEFLYLVEKKISLLSRKLELLDAYKTGVIEKIFSRQLRFRDSTGNFYPDFTLHPLSALAGIYDGTHMTPDYQELGVPFYSVEHLTNDNFIDTKFISEDVFEKENKRVMLEKGDVLMTRIGDIGTAKFIDWDVRASFYVSLALIKPKKIFGKYLAQYIGSDFFQRELHHRTIHAAFPKKINLGEIGECIVQLPCDEEQKKIAEFLALLDIDILNARKCLRLTQEFKQGLLQKMFI
jgi:type I restriction enzyme S subunit